MFEPITISEAARRIQSRQLSPTDLVERCLEQIHRDDEQVHAWVAVDEQAARRTARQLEEELVRGNCRGPLHGIPIGVKDIIDVAGFATRAGSPITSERVRQTDAPLVAALRRAGAIILGKTVTCEFAGFDPSATRNPWSPRLSHTPGGSSSGSAVAVAMGMCLGAIGTQTGGSLVRPASYCGVSACKPTFGRVPTDGIVPVSHHLDHPGPIARTAGDLACILPCLLDAGEPTLAETSDLPRLGFVEAFFVEQADDSIRRITKSAVAEIAQDGAQIEPVALPDSFAHVRRMHRRIMAAEAAAVHHRTFNAHRRAYGPLISTMLEEGLALSAVDYAEALAHQRDFRRQIASVLGPCKPPDALIMPATDTTAPPRLDTTGDPRFQLPWSYAGLPVVSIPCGLASDGMPAALQLVGRCNEEMALLEVARWCEDRLAFSALPPLLA